jgi:general secretion pathway protein C
VRPDDALARLGIADGDVILRVNGLAVASPDRCLEAYARLRAADRLTVEILRGGRGRTLVYVIA